jgi:hypothetical protein
VISLNAKISAVLGSLRFWIVTLAWLSAYLGMVQQHGFDVVQLLDQVAKWLGSVGLIGTGDKWFKLLGDALAALRKPAA